MTLNLPPFPRDREFYIVTDELDIRQVEYSDDYMHYTGRETYCRNDGESGSWEPSEIIGWTDDYTVAEEYVKAEVEGG